MGLMGPNGPMGSMGPIDAPGFGGKSTGYGAGTKGGVLFTKLWPPEISGTSFFSTSFINFSLRLRLLDCDRRPGAARARESERPETRAAPSRISWARAGEGLSRGSAHSRSVRFPLPPAHGR